MSANTDFDIVFKKAFLLSSHFVDSYSHSHNSVRCGVRPGLQPCDYTPKHLPPKHCADKCIDVREARFFLKKMLLNYELTILLIIAYPSQK